LREHPRGASSWKLHSVQEVLKLKGHVHVWNETECGGRNAVGEETNDIHDELGIHRGRLELKCEGQHRHLVLVGGRAASAEILPEELCADTLRGLRVQMVQDG
jgi:hypothetical protein